MPVFKADELDIQFPFEPYDVQKELMLKVVECLRLRQNGLLESPTGTGKTLSLLCAAIAWQRKQRNFVKNITEASLRMEPGMNRQNNPNIAAAFSIPKIIYSSRTHSQLSQAVQELKRSAYKDTKAIVLGSRDLMCVNEEVARLESSYAKIMACQIKVRSFTCRFYNNMSKKKEDPSVRDQMVVDIEDIVKKGRRDTYCPFFMSREFVQDSEVVFMPYNYLLDPKLRSTHGIDIKNSVIILDEGHNIAKICEESVSFEIKSSTIAHCIQEVTKALNEFSETQNQLGNNALTKDLSLGELLQLKKSFLELEAELDTIQTTSEGILLPGNQLLQIIFQNGFPPSSLLKIVDLLDKVSTFLSGNHTEASGCDKFSAILRVLSSGSIFRDVVKFADSYKVFVQFEESKRAKTDIRAYDTNKTKGGKMFNFWCFNPALGLETLIMHGPRCVLLASGTLSPMSFLMKELQIPFPVQLTNPHIIKDNQLFASVVTCGPGGTRLSSSFQNRSDKNYLKSLGELIRQVCSVVPKGVLVFFPSYSVMELCRREWEQTGLWAQMESVKKLMIEPRGKEAFRKCMDDYYEAVKSSQGGCLMAVCRGKVSEGLDFTDDNGRAVIITGIPYSPAKDPHVLAKQQYLNAKQSRGENDCIGGSTWYQLEATRALNQAIGRIIRHAYDYGAILICDERCSAPNFQSNLSAWVQKRIKISRNFDESLRELGQFFGASVQKERREYAKSLQINIRKSVKIQREETEEIRADVTNQDLEDLYSDNKCVVEFSKGRRDESSKEPLATLPAGKNRIVMRKEPTITCLGDLSSAPVKVDKGDFHTAVPVYVKPFAAFSKSPSCDPKKPQENQKKRIKLASSNFSYTARPSAGETMLGNGGTGNASSFGSVTTQASEFKDMKEFWDWVKSVIPAHQNLFVKALKTLRANRKDTEELERVYRLVPMELRKIFADGMVQLKLMNSSEARCLASAL